MPKKKRRGPGPEARRREREEKRRREAERVGRSIDRTIRALERLARD